MVTEVRISRSLLHRIVADARADPRRERCGLLLGTAGAIADFLPAANVASRPERRFEIDPAVLLAAHRRARGGGAPVIGHYHSHTSGRAWPSPTDAADSAGDAALWLIVGAADVALFRARIGGAIHGAFDPVPIRDVMPPSSKCQMIDASDA